MRNCCILFHFYIKPQHISILLNHHLSCILFHFYIKPQLFLCFYSYRGRCILFHFYIKPQLNGRINTCTFCCILFHFYIKPQQKVWKTFPDLRCILFHFYIKPQRDENFNEFIGVVSYSISTSNHNSKSFPLFLFRLYLIPFLHQTTTGSLFLLLFTSCILFHFYIKPQRFSALFGLTDGCILFHFYIKPQQSKSNNYQVYVVSYSISTSNHNLFVRMDLDRVLYLIPFLHQTTTTSCSKVDLCGCILFHFYIKPQPMAHKTLFSSTLSPKSHSHFQRNAVV